MRERFRQLTLISYTICFSWLAMMAVHEFGHALTGWLTGGTVRRIVLPIVGFSRTDLSTNPHLLAVAWGGCVWGSLLPLALFAALPRSISRFWFLAKFFAGFCCIANGAYLAGGVWLAAGDAGDLLAHGAQRWHLVAFGIPAIALGLWLWNGIGPNFGLGRQQGHVDKLTAEMAAGICAAIIAMYTILAITTN
ncbi:MAG TPA: hypothetical protein VGN12_23145 [Pirellulales bacterium]|jgi:hypothetical protein